MGDEKRPHCPTEKKDEGLAAARPFFIALPSLTGEDGGRDQLDQHQHQDHSSLLCHH